MKYNSRFKLTPCPATNRWRKIHKGKTYYVGVGHCNSKTDREGYKVAIAEWRALLDKVESKPTEEDEALYQEHLENERFLAELSERSKRSNPTGRIIEIDGKRFTARHYDDMMAKAIAKVEGRAPLKALRKTGASMRDSHDLYFSCVEAYLGHAVKTVTDRSYLSGARERFDSAIRWLGEQYGIS